MVNMGICDIAKLYFRYSFLGRLTDTCSKRNSFFEESKIIRGVSNIYKKTKHRLKHYLEASLTNKLVKLLRKDFSLFAVRNISIAVIAFVAADIFFSIVILKKKIELQGWLIRGLLIYIGIGGLFCNANWQDVKENSFFYKYLLQKQKMSLK
jgi:hypothetical protein